MRGMTASGWGDMGRTPMKRRAWRIISGTGVFLALAFGSVAAQAEDSPAPVTTAVPGAVTLTPASGPASGKGEVVLSGPARSFTQVETGGRHTLALDNTGQVYAWGVGTVGQLGNGNGKSHGAPFPVELPAGVTATGISSGQAHSLALGDDGRVYAWGDNSFGQLGDGIRGDHRLTPSPVDGLIKEKSIIRVFASPNASFAIDEDGALYSWGSNRDGQLGREDVTVGAYSANAGIVAAPAGLGQEFGWEQVSAPKSNGLSTDPRTHVLALGSDGLVYSWGSNQASALGQSGIDINGYRATPAEADRLTAATDSPIAQVAAGASATSFVLDSHGVMWSWGAAHHGGLAREGASNTMYPIPAAISDGCVGDRQVTHIELGDHNGTALMADGTVCAWGLGDVGQLGDLPGSTWTTHTPREYAPLPDDATVQGMSLGAPSTAANSGVSFIVGSNGRIYSSGLRDETILGVKNIPTTQNRQEGTTHALLSAHFTTGPVTWDTTTLPGETTQPGEETDGTISMTITVPSRTREEVASSGLTVEVTSTTYVVGGDGLSGHSSPFDGRQSIPWAPVSYVYWPYTPDPVILSATNSQITGTGVPEGIVTVTTADGDELCQETVTPAGDWFCTPADDTVGTSSIVVVQSEPSADRSGPSNPVTGTMAPQSEPALDEELPSTEESSEGQTPAKTAPSEETSGITDTSDSPGVYRPTTDRVTGVGIPESTITVRDNTKTSVCETKVSSNSTWVCEFDTPAQPETQITVAQSVPALQVSNPVEATIAHPLTVAMPQYGAISGTGEPGSTLTFEHDDTSLSDPVQVSAGGIWSTDLPRNGREELLVTVTQIDADETITGVQLVKHLAPSHPADHEQSKLADTHQVSIVSDVSFPPAQVSPLLSAVVIGSGLAGTGLVTGHIVSTRRR